MKFKALILLFCIVAFVGEWISMPSRMMNMSACAAPKAALHSCCKEGAKHASLPAGKEKRNDSGASDCCMLCCPMGYLTILSHFPELIVPIVPVKKSYPAYQANAIYGYHADAWRPPIIA